MRHKFVGSLFTMTVYLLLPVVL